MSPLMTTLPILMKRYSRFSSSVMSELRVMILLMACTGLRMGAFEGLQWFHFVEMPEQRIYRITVYAKSFKDKYYTFCAPECAAAIDSYLDYRRRLGDPLKMTTPLIREQFDIRQICSSISQCIILYWDHLHYQRVTQALRNKNKRKSCEHMALENSPSH